MSHIATVEIEIKDLDALGRAAQRCGLELVKDQKTFRWYGKWMNDYSADDAAYKKLGIDPKDYGKCEHAIRIPGSKTAYEIGIIHKPDGNGFALLFDFFDGGKGLMGKVSANPGYQDCGKLMQFYGLEVAKAKARQGGFQVIERAGQDGSINLVCTR